jgi:hypothetical protein
VPTARGSRLDAVVARVVSGELPIRTDNTASAMWDVLCDPDDWNLDELFGALAPLDALSPGPRREKGLVRLDQTTVVWGDLVVDGDLEVLSHTLVLGDVRCTGYIYSGIHDCFIVAGDVKARAIEALRSYWLVDGSIDTQTAWLATYGFLNQRSTLRARLLVLEMYFELQHDEVVAETRIETDYLPNDEAARTTLARVIDLEGLIDDKHVVDTWELLRRVARGKPVFRAPASRSRT